MPQFSRRTLLQSSAIMAAPLFPARGGPGINRNLLTKVWTVDRVAKVLIPRERFRPFPAAGERGAWEALPADVRAALVQSAEKQLKTTWEALPATLALEFKRNGNRSRYEAVRDRRRKKLQDLVIAEGIEGKGRFIDEIANGIWLTCEESFWGIPAHLGAQKAGTGLPDVTEPIVDLFAAETASLLSWTAYLLAPQLTGVSKLIPERIRVETDRRLLTPCLTRDDFGWMGFNGKPVNNWNPWISSNWLTAALLQETDERRRQAAVHKILRCLDNFMNGYADDGGCDEGPGYWGRAGASLFDCLELLHSASDGALNGFSQPLVREIGLYICRAHVFNEWYTNFADAPARVDINGDLIYRFGKRVQDETMMLHGAFGAFLRDADAIPRDSIGRQLPALFNLAALRQAPRAQSLLRDTWLPGIQVMAARVKADSAQGLYLAAQGGHNAESHNHNDVGNFLVYASGAPVIVDVGVETYTAKTFSPKRYEIWTMQSAYHNCPTIDGVMQAAGREFAASAVAYRSDDAVAEFRLNLARAYPKEANLEVWNRTLRLDRLKNQIEVLDNWRLTRAAKTITLTLMTPCKVTQKASGVLSLAVAAGNVINVLYDGRVFTPAIEEIRLEDARLRLSWGERLYRILLTAENAGAEGNWSMRIIQP
jgi:Heparinase II/III-like protein